MQVRISLPEIIYPVSQYRCLYELQSPDCRCAGSLKCGQLSEDKYKVKLFLC
jgi:hypothetical protein